MSQAGSQRGQSCACVGGPGAVGGGEEESLS